MRASKGAIFTMGGAILAPVMIWALAVCADGDTPAKLPTLIEFGAGKCKTCKRMAPIIEALKEDLHGKVNVIANDVHKDAETWKKHGIVSIPTQLFLDADGREVFRHEGFFPREEILAQLAKMGVDVGELPAEPQADAQPESGLMALIRSGGALAFPAAFIGGLLTAMNPCVLVMIPLIVGFLGGQSEMSVRRSFLYSLVFVLGFSLELVLLYTVMASLAPYIRGEWMNYVVAAICIVIGLHFLELFQIPLLVSQDKLPEYTGALGALIIGFLFGLISLPCTGPALALIISLIPVKGRLFGGGLMLAYGLGHCMLILVAGTSMGAAQGLIASKGAQTATKVIKKVAAVLIILVGVYFIVVGA